MIFHTLGVVFAPLVFILILFAAFASLAVRLFRSFAALASFAVKLCPFLRVLRGLAVKLYGFSA